MTAVQGIFVREGTAERRGLQRNHNTTPVPIEGNPVQCQLNKNLSRYFPPDPQVIIPSRRYASDCSVTITSDPGFYRS